MSVIHVQTFTTPYGDLLLGSYRGELCLCDWRYRRMRASIDHRVGKGAEAEFVEKDDDLLALTRDQLTDFFHRRRESFELPLKLIGSDFQRRVWQELRHIDYGQTLSYAQLAQRVGNSRAVRAVASANGANALSIIVPCHRVIGSDGSLTGYAGGIDVKRKLLALEASLL